MLNGKLDDATVFCATHRQAACQCDVPIGDQGLNAFTGSPGGVS